MTERDGAELNLSGRRILVVEDETLVSMLLEDALHEAGAEIVGPASRVEKALALVEDSGTPIDAAVLDVNLAGREIFPVAEALARRRTPFVFATGYGRASLPEAWRSSPVLHKPFDVDDVKKALCGALAASRAESAC